MCIVRIYDTNISFLSGTKKGPICTRNFLFKIGATHLLVNMVNIDLNTTSWKMPKKVV